MSALQAKLVGCERPRLPVRSALLPSTAPALALRRAIRRAVGTGAAVGIGLALLDVDAATAGTLVFVEREGPANPFEGFAGSSSAVANFADIDDDGDLDMFFGNYFGSVGFLGNLGSATSPDFQPGANPLGGVDFTLYFEFGYLHYGLSPCLRDIDGDADLDVVFGSRESPLRYFENTGSASSPAFSLRTGVSNPFPGLGPGEWRVPELADLDGDGDLDLAVGRNASSLRYFENQGSAQGPSFVEQTGASSPFDGLLIQGAIGDQGRAVPRLADVDGDGDLDLVVGNYYDGTFQYFENLGDSQTPAFVERTGNENPFEPFDVGESAAPDLADVDGDNDLDMVSGSDFSQNDDFFYYEQVSTKLPAGPWVGLGAFLGLLTTGLRLARTRLSAARPPEPGG